MSFNRRLGLWLYLYSFSAFLILLTFGLHSVFSRYYIKHFYGSLYNFVILLGAAETFSQVFSLVGGLSADIMGRRKLILLGYIGPFSYFMISIFGIKYIIPLIFIAGIGESIVLTSSAGTVLDRGRSSGSIYAIYSAGMPLGWGLSGLIFPILPLDIHLVYKILAFIELISVTIFYLAYPGDSGSPISINDVINVLRVKGSSLLMLALFISLMNVSLELFWNGFYFKLIDIVGGEMLLFGLVYNAFPATMGFISRFITGYIVDKYKPIYLLALLPILITLVSSGMYYSNGLLVILFWLIPVYGIYEVSTVVSVSRVLPSESQATAMGVTILARSLGGIALFIIGSVISLASGIILSIIVSLSIFMLLLVYRLITH